MKYCFASDDGGAETGKCGKTYPVSTSTCQKKTEPARLECHCAGEACNTLKDGTSKDDKKSGAERAMAVVTSAVIGMTAAILLAF